MRKALQAVARFNSVSNFGSLLPGDWIVGPLSPKTNRPTAFKILDHVRMALNDSKFAAILEEEKFPGAHVMDLDEAKALRLVAAQRLSVFEDGLSGEKPRINAVRLDKKFWLSSPVPNAPEAGYLYNILEGQSGIEGKNTLSGYTIIVRDAPELILK